MEFKVGDRIVIAGDRDKTVLHDFIGLTGTVVKAEPGEIGVSFDCHTKGHTCGGLAETGHGWWIFAKEYGAVKKIDEYSAEIEVSDFL